MSNELTRLRSVMEGDPTGEVPGWLSCDELAAKARQRALDVLGPLLLDVADSAAEACDSGQTRHLLRDVIALRVGIRAHLGTELI